MVVWIPEDIVCAVIGGILIAISATLNLWIYGRVSGLSGIFNSVIKYDKKNGFFYKFCFFVGIITFPTIFGLRYHESIVLGDIKLTFFDSNE
jgi:hypothetical protein